MTKRQGFNIRIEAFLPIDKTDFAAQAAAFQTIADIQKTGKLPDGFLDRVTILGITPKQGTADIAEPAKPEPAETPLTTDPLPEGAAVLEAATALDGTIFQTVKLADGSETFRRISAEQDAEENKPPVTEMVENVVTKRGGKAAAE